MSGAKREEVSVVVVEYRDAALLSGFRERVSALGSWGWDYVANTRASAIIDRPDAARIDWTE